MNKTEFIKICTMKADGYTLQEIADAMGCSKQYIHQLLNETLCEKGRKIPSKFVYRNLAREILNTYRSVPKFCEDKGLKYNRMCDLLRDRRRVTLDEAIFFSDLFNKDIRYLFEKKAKEVG